MVVFNTPHQTDYACDIHRNDHIALENNIITDITSNDMSITVARTGSVVDLATAGGGGGGPTTSYAVACPTIGGSQYTYPGNAIHWLPLTSQLVAGTDLSIHDDEIHIDVTGWYVVYMQVYAAFTHDADMSLYFTIAGSAVSGNALLNLLVPQIGIQTVPDVAGFGMEQSYSVCSPPVHLTAGTAVHMYLSVSTYTAGTVGLNTNNDGVTQLCVQKVA